eukprot:1121196-Rhodomonas_salina.1
MPKEDTDRTSIVMTYQDTDGKLTQMTPHHKVNRTHPKRHKQQGNTDDITGHTHSKLKVGRVTPKVKLSDQKVSPQHRNSQQKDTRFHKHRRNRKKKKKTTSPRDLFIMVTSRRTCTGLGGRGSRSRTPRSQTRCPECRSRCASGPYASPPQAPYGAYPPAKRTRLRPDTPCPRPSSRIAPASPVCAPSSSVLDIGQYMHIAYRNRIRQYGTAHSKRIHQYGTNTGLHMALSTTREIA